MRLYGKGKSQSGHWHLALSIWFKTRGATAGRRARDRWVVPSAKCALAPQDPHHPPGDEYSANKHSEAIQAIADLLARGVALGDAEDDGSEDGEQHGCAEMGQLQIHGFFPMAM